MLCLDGREVGHGLPPRPLGLMELRELLLGPEATRDLKDAVWKELVCRARVGGGDWVVACIGMALPGLRSTAARVLRRSPDRLADDVVSEMLTEFVAQLPRVDLDRAGIAARLLCWGRKGALRERGRGLRVEPHDPHEIQNLADRANALSVEGARGTACSSLVEPADLLELAVRKQVISPDDAELIRVTRLQGRRLRHYARELGEAESKLYSRRERAEARLVGAMASGQISVTAVDQVPNAAPDEVLSQ